MWTAADDQGSPRGPVRDPFADIGFNVAAGLEGDFPQWVHFNSEQIKDSIGTSHQSPGGAADEFRGPSESQGMGDPLPDPLPRPLADSTTGQTPGPSGLPSSDAPGHAKHSDASGGSIAAPGTTTAAPSTPPLAALTGPGSDAKANNLRNLGPLGNLLSANGARSLALARPLDVRGAAAQMVEGQISGSVLLATFTDPNGGLTGSAYRANIDWGDGTKSAGTVTSANGDFEVRGVHAYSTAGTEAVKVAVTSAHGRAGSGTTTVHVADAALTLTANSITATAGRTYQGVVATFRDPGVGKPSDFAASIQWGDGHSSVGTITAMGTGTYQIAGKNLYARNGSYTTAVEVLDRSGSKASGSGRAFVVAGQPNSGSTSPGGSRHSALLTRLRSSAPSHL